MTPPVNGSWLAAFIVTLTLVFSASFATAGEQQAREFHKQAKSAYDQGDFERAADLLQKAYDEDPNVVYQYNRIRALEGAGQFDRALDILAEYRDEMRAEGYSDLGKLKKTLEEKRQRKADRPDDASGDPTTEGESPGTMEGPSGPSGPADGSSAKFQPTPLTWVLWGVSVGAFIPGGLLATGLFVDRDNPDAVRTQRLTSAILLGTGALTGAAGGLTLLLNKNSDRNARGPSPQPSSGPSVRIAPMVGPGGGGAILDISF